MPVAVALADPRQCLGAGTGGVEMAHDRLHALDLRIQAQDVHALIRKVLTGLYDVTVAQGVRIQYGGSVKANNAKELFGMPDIDGGLIGGAALDAKSFIDIVRAAV